MNGGGARSLPGLNTSTNVVITMHPLQGFGEMSISLWLSGPPKKYLIFICFYAMLTVKNKNAHWVMHGYTTYSSNFVFLFGWGGSILRQLLPFGQHSWLQGTFMNYVKSSSANTIHGQVQFLQSCWSVNLRQRCSLHSPSWPSKGRLSGQAGNWKRSSGPQPRQCSFWNTKWH